MWRITVSILVLVSVMLVLGLAPQATTAPGSAQDPATLRVGVYDSRVIAFAWFHSKHNDINDKLKEYEQAKLAGDEKRIKEFEEWGPKSQRRLHFQVFGRAPVTEYFTPIEDQLPALAKELGVDVIAFECNYARDDVQVFDISLELAKLYDPTPKTMKMAKEMLDHDPVPLEELTDDDH